ncbi:hypothetical protein ACJX0J_032648, partial [Zea mays]
QCDSIEEHPTSFLDRNTIRNIMYWKEHLHKDGEAHIALECSTVFATVFFCFQIFAKLLVPYLLWLYCLCSKLEVLKVLKELHEFIIR